MSNICVISKTEDLAVLLQQHPSAINEAVVETALPDDEKLHRAGIILLDIEPEESELFVTHYEGTAALIILCSKKAEARLALLKERWKDENTHECELLVKPFKLVHLCAAIERSIQSAKRHKMMVMGDYVLEAHHQVLRYKNIMITLTEKEVQLLTCLHTHHPEAVNKHALLKEVWGYEKDIDTHTLETHIYRLRQKLDESAPLICTKGDGYGLDI